MKNILNTCQCIDADAAYYMSEAKTALAFLTRDGSKPRSEQVLSTVEERTARLKAINFLNDAVFYLELIRRSFQESSLSEFRTSKTFPPIVREFHLTGSGLTETVRDGTRIDIEDIKLDEADKTEADSKYDELYPEMSAREWLERNCGA